MHRRLLLAWSDESLPPGWAHLPIGIEPEWIKQLVSEQLVTVRDRRGFSRCEWQKLRERNEALDCAVLPRAAFMNLAPIDAERRSGRRRSLRRAKTMRRPASGRHHGGPVGRLSAADRAVEGVPAVEFGLTLRNQRSEEGSFRMRCRAVPNREPSRAPKLAMREGGL